MRRLAVIDSDDEVLVVPSWSRPRKVRAASTTSTSSSIVESDSKAFSSSCTSPNAYEDDFATPPPPPKGAKGLAVSKAEPSGFYCGTDPYVEIDVPATGGPKASAAVKARTSSLRRPCQTPLEKCIPSSRLTKKVKVDVNKSKPATTTASHGRQSTLSMFFKRPAVKKARELSPEFRLSAEDDEDTEFATEDEEDEEDFIEADRSQKSRPTAGKSYRNKGAWEPRFRAGKPVKRIKDVPTLSQALQMEREAKAKENRGDFPPISDLSDIFADIVRRTPGIEALAKTLEKRPLRVATMCSGTESPLLALNLISRSIRDQYGISIQIQHVFSCEIEPYKQAYIERNFSPPILFRDVCELGRDQAHTAYGALVDVPGNVDLLVAGTSCVDYSNLNSKKKGMEEGGESGRTFFGMLNWVKRHQPAIVLLENVKSAPWSGVGEAFSDINYDAAWSNTFDTKNYYIPHTRQRGYLIATQNRKDSYAGNWEALTRSLARPASSSLEDFLLAPDDPRIQKVRLQFALGEGFGKGRSTIDWSKCQQRHERARDEEELGKSRPFTAWEEGGTCHLSDEAWNEWALPQPERVLDLLDITILRAAKEGIDPHYKSRVWELSQNVDRNIASSRPGICMCITPSGMPYLTSRGGPMIGLEALSLQGLPIDELLLTRESNDQLQNLAGNAMSSTVVGTCVLAALVIAQPDLEARRSAGQATMEGDDVNRDEQRVMTRDGQQGTRIIGNAEERAYDITSCARLSIPSLLEAAVASSQRCACEGRQGMTEEAVYLCSSCHYTVCATCKGRPQHHFHIDERPRKNPALFAEVLLKRALPMRLWLQCEDIQGDLRKVAEGRTFADNKLLHRWINRVSQVLGEGVEIRFSELLRQRTWLASYSGYGIRLELNLDAQQPQWRLYVLPAEDEVVGSQLRKLLQQPVARLRLDMDGSKGKVRLLDGQWDVCLPSTERVSSQFRHHGELVSTWQAKMGIGGGFAGTKRYSRIEVSVDSARKDLDLDVSGDYVLLDECGTANASLFKRTSVAGGAAASQDLYFFLDPDRFKGGDSDRLVFATEIAKLPHPLVRVIVAGAPSGWKPRPAKTTKSEVPAEYTESVQLAVGGCWRPWPTLRTSTPSHFSAHLELAEKESFVLSPCQEASAIATVSSSVFGSARKLWPKVESEWYQVDLEHHAATTFRSLAWLTERLQLPATLCSWMDVQHDSHDDCQRCAPNPPAIQWLHVKNRPPVPVENEQQAGPYEQALKKRPAPFVVQLRLEGARGQVKIGVNAQTLAHRAMARLPYNEAAQTRVRLTWRLSQTDPTLDLFNLPKYRLSSNRRDTESGDPAIFKIPLRKEQKRSLHWMLEQESDCVAPFEEEEVAEGQLAPLGWRVEGRATRNVAVKGGVLADAVGYGKTAISLGLIASKPGVKDRAGDKEAGFVPTKATLVIVPPHLCKQWEAEVYKFCGKSLKVIVIFSKGNLNSVSVEDIQEADIVIMSVSVYKSDAYFDSLARLAAANPIPAKAGRYFDASLQLSLQGLRNRMRELQTEGVAVVEKSVRERVDFDASHFTARTASKRLIGQACLDAHQEAMSSEEASLTQVEVTADDALSALKKAEAKSVGGDIWGLKTKAARKDWRRVLALPLEAFSWQRVVVDEFHYIAETADRAFSAIKQLRACATWILSGTPPTADFADVQSIAAFLHVHLGVPDDEDSIKSSVRQRRDRSRTQAEQFRNFVDIRSADWHHRRQAVAQHFLDQYVRQNVAEIDEIPMETLIKPIRMPAAERACYLELAHMIEALDLRHAKRLFKASQKTQAAAKDNKRKVGEIDSGNDRDLRLQKTLGESSSPEEALSRQASHFILTEEGEQKMSNAIEACEYIVAERLEQRDDCLSQIQRDLAVAIEQHFVVLLQRRFRDETKQALVTFVKNVETGAWGDEDCKPVLMEMLARSGCTKVGLSREKGKKLYPSWKQKREDKGADWLEEHKLRDIVHMLQRLRNEYWSRVRSLRYFQTVRDIQKARSNVRQLSIVCPSNKCSKAGKILTLEEISIASTCGHSGCKECVLREAYIGKCCTENCHALAKPASIVLASTLGDEKDTTTAYGIKLATVATILKKVIPKKERILLFVQYEGLLKKVSEALEEYGVNFVRLRGSASTRSSQLTSFQEGTQKVLLLNIADESAAGSNLTVANHVIFLSPLIAEEEQSYHATMDQAKGRAVRFGQTKEVKIWRFYVRDTIDQAVLERRESLQLAAMAAQGEPLELIDVRKG